MGTLGPEPVPLWSVVRDGCVLQNCHGRHFHGVSQEGESGSLLAGKGFPPPLFFVGVGMRLFTSWQRLFSLIRFPWAP